MHAAHDVQPGSRRFPYRRPPIVRHAATHRRDTDDKASRPGGHRFGHGQVRYSQIDGAAGETQLAGEGIAVDAVVADFIAGAAELISPDNDPDHWDVIEGQGSLFHPGYSGVSLGLLHGSQPDAFVVCHEATRKTVIGWDRYTLPSLTDCIEMHILMGRRTNPAIRCVGISINTSGLAPTKRSGYLAERSRETGLPCVDPMLDGCGAILRQIRNEFYGAP